MFVLVPIVIIQEFLDKYKKKQIIKPLNKPVNPSPRDGAINQPILLTLTWECYNPDNRSLYYDLNFGTSENNLGLIKSNLTEKQFNLEALDFNVIYYWLIVVKDNNNFNKTGDVWMFKTKDISPQLHKKAEQPLEVDSYQREKGKQYANLIIC